MHCKGRKQVLLLLRQVVRITTFQMENVNFIRFCNKHNNKNIFLIFCRPCISIYFFINIIQLDALNFIISLFQASTCFEHMCSLSGGQKLYYTVSGIVTAIGGRPVQSVYGTATYRCDDTRDCIIQFLPS